MRRLFADTLLLKFFISNYLTYNYNPSIYDLEIFLSWSLKESVIKTSKTERTEDIITKKGNKRYN